MAVAAAVLWWRLPPPAPETPAAPWVQEGHVLRGAYHVHSTVSDGSGRLEDIAAAAARSGLQFVIVTDHGDGTRLAPPRYLSGVLCIEAVEINTSGGHLVALGARPSAYPLAGTPAAVVEDVHRLGGLAIAAHPASPRASLAWRDWSVPLDGIEWLNADSEWRDELLGSVGRLLFTYALRPVATLASALDRPVAALAAWDAGVGRSRLVALAGADAHARLGLRSQSEPYEDGWFLKVPSYEASFRVFGVRVVSLGPLTGDAVHDAGVVLATIRDGRVYSVIDGLGTPGTFDFTATSGGRLARMGDYLEPTGEVMLHARMAAPPGARMVVRRDGEALYDTEQTELRLGVPAEPAVYRVEVDVPGTRGTPPIPWIVSNPIYVGMREAHRLPAPPPLPVRARQPVATEAWQAEASAASSSVLQRADAGGGLAAWSWRFQLAAGDPAGQYAAVSFPMAGLPAGGRVQLRARADRPMRVWIQLRASTSGDGDRWGTSIYLDERLRTYDLPAAAMDGLGVTASREAPLASVDALLVVADTVNTRPGDGGRVDLAELWIVEP